MSTLEIPSAVKNVWDLGVSVFKTPIDFFSDLSMFTDSFSEITNMTSLIAKLPSPSNLQFSFPKDWSPEATGAFSGDGEYTIYGASGDVLVTNLISKFQLGDAGSAGFSNAYKKSLNKNEKMIFQTLNFRSIDLEWNLVPKSAKEARDIETLIYLLKIYSAPYDAAGQGTWDFPDTFELKIESKQGGFIAFKTPEMACTNLTVNHTPQGFVANHVDGYPVQTTLSMSFLERELAVREKLISKRII